MNEQQLAKLHSSSYGAEIAFQIQAAELVNLIKLSDKDEAAYFMLQHAFNRQSCDEILSFIVKVNSALIAKKAYDNQPKLEAKK